MKTIAELKAETFIYCEDCDRWMSSSDYAYHNADHTIIRKEFIERQSLKDSIAEKVAGCYELVKEGKVSITNCCNVPPEQKCKGCQRLLEWERENLEG